jgi:dolichol-phosphate mannosyltransferase
MSREVSVVVPVYNNQESLTQLAREITSEFAGYKDFELDLVFIDDGSTDGSWQTIQKLSGLQTGIRGYRLTRNFGQLSAMKAGYSLAHGEALISISADLQDSPSLISAMLDAWTSGERLVICARKSRQDGILTKVTSEVAYSLLRFETPDIPRGGFDYFLIDRRIYLELNKMAGRFNFLQGDILSLGYTPFIINYSRAPRPFGKSAYTFRKRLENFTTAWYDSSYSLIKGMRNLGLIVSGSGFLLGLAAIALKLFGLAPFSGFTILVCSILFIGGVQLIFTGVIAEYVWRIYDLGRGKPGFVIQESTTGEV